MISPSGAPSGHRLEHRSPVRAVLLLAGSLLAVPGAAGPAIHVIEREELTLEVRPLTARTVGEPEGGHLLELGESSSAELELDVLWPEPETPTRLRLRATRRLSPAGPLVRLESEWRGPGRAEPVRAERELLFTSESTTALFEVARSGERSLTLAVAGELTRREEFSAWPVVGSPVQFRLEIEWVERGRSVTLETNRLQTFVGQSVGYSFRLGETDEAQSASLRLLPVQLAGDTARIEVEVSATMPDDERGLVLVSRKEQWLTTRGATSTLSLADGEPPTGFRFLVTPRF